MRFLGKREMSFTVRSAADNGIMGETQKGL